MSVARSLFPRSRLANPQNLYWNPNLPSMAVRQLEGVFAVNKPTGPSSAQVLRDLQYYFNPSKFFQPWLDDLRDQRDRETPQDRKRRTKAKRAISVKMGHGGTLDPLATGVLIVGVGAATKQLPNFLGCIKSYEAVVVFGAATDSYDVLGKVLGRQETAHLTKEMVNKALKKFRGKGKQTPPLYSALRLDGKRLYEYAREGKPLPREIEQRDVDVKELTLVEWYDAGTHNFQLPEHEAEPQEKELAAQFLRPLSPSASDRGSESPKSTTDTGPDADAASTTGESHIEDKAVLKRSLEEDADDTKNSVSKRSKQDSTQIEEVSGTELPQVETAQKASLGQTPACRIRMTVSSGFYVRSLCHDLGKAVGSLACLSDLKRTQQGEFRLGKNVIGFEDFEKGEDHWAPQLRRLLDDWRITQEGEEGDWLSQSSRRI